MITGEEKTEDARCTMKATAAIFAAVLAMVFFAASGARVLGETDTGKDCIQNADYLVDGLVYRAEGNCEESLRSYQMARKLGQFKEEWMYHLAAADCLVALKRFDEAIESYTIIIGAVANRTLKAEMYKGRARAYYLKSSRPDSIDAKLIALAKKDLGMALDLGADVGEVSVLQRNIRDDIEHKKIKN